MMLLLAYLSVNLIVYGALGLYAEIHLAATGKYPQITERTEPLSIRTIRPIRTLLFGAPALILLLLLTTVQKLLPEK